jgi:hypothetical protein
MHYGLLWFLLSLFICKLIVNDFVRKQPALSLLVNSNIDYGKESLFSIFPLVAISTKQLLDERLFIIVLCGTALFSFIYVLNNGCFNITLFFLKYKQYKVKGEASEYWLISRTNIRDFKRIIHVYEMTDKIFIHYE